MRGRAFCKLCSVFFCLTLKDARANEIGLIQLERNGGPGKIRTYDYSVMSGGL